MALKRQGLKGGSLAALTGVMNNAKKKEKRFFSGDSFYTGFHNVNDGDNIFRVCPPHEEGGAAYLACRRSQLPVEVDEYKDGEKTGEKVVKDKKIFIATQHCDSMEKDPIELYIEFVMERANDEFDDKKDRQKFTAPIFGYRNREKKWVWGITPMTEYICYAYNEASELARLQLRESWINDMLKAANDGEGEMPDIDPYSDPVEGHPFKITKQKTEKGKWEYPIVKINPDANKRESWEAFYERTALTEKQLEELKSKESLSKLYINSYSQSDFNLALDGLRRFDKKAGYGIFNNSEFLEQLEEISKTVPEDPKQEEKDKKSGKDIEQAFSGDKKEEAPQTPATSEGEIDMRIPRMKRALKKFIKDEFGDNKDLLNQVPNELETLQVWHDKMMEGDDLPLKFEDEEPASETTPETETTQEQEGDFMGDEDEQAFQKEIANLRNRRRGNK